jgi:hypothetical protein
MAANHTGQICGKICISMYLSNFILICAHLLHIYLSCLYSKLLDLHIFISTERMLNSVGVSMQKQPLIHEGNSLYENCS